MNLYGFVGNVGVGRIDVLGHGFWDWIQRLFDFSDQTQTAQARDICLATGAAILAGECIKARNALIECINKGGCDLAAALEYRDRVCKVAEKGCCAAAGSD